jgi:hypothetical protein
MAERRMFAKTIIGSDAFCDMPQSTQLLYFHLAMGADDDGFVNNPKSIIRNIGSKDDDISILIAKKFIIPFDSGVIVIKHWRIHNYIQSDRYIETKYKKEKSTLFIDENKSYSTYLTDINNGVSILDTQTADTQVRKGEDSIGKDSKKESKETGETFDDIINAFTQYEPLREALSEFLKIRKRIKAPLTNNSLKRLLNNRNTGLFSLCGGDNQLATEIVNQSVILAYRGFFPLKNTNTKQGNAFLDVLKEV